MSSSSAADVPIPDGLIARRKPGPESAQGADGAGTADEAKTLIGIVEQGVEARSIVLLGDTGAALAQLVGQPAVAYPFGARIEVTGQFLPGLQTSAQQGPQFRVSALKAVR